jgi:YggT family protein
MNSASLIEFLVNFVLILKDIIFFLIIGRVLFSWLRMSNRSQRTKLELWVFEVTEPIIALARKLPHRIGMIDLAPLIAMLGVDLLGQLVAGLLINLI